MSHNPLADIGPRHLVQEGVFPAYEFAKHLVGTLCVMRAMGDALASPPTPEQVDGFRKFRRMLLDEVGCLAKKLAPVVGELTKTAAATNNGPISGCGESGANAHDVIHRVGYAMVKYLMIALGGQPGSEPDTVVSSPLSGKNRDAVCQALSRLDADQLHWLEALARQESILTLERLRA